MMVAPVIFLRELALAVNRAAKFTAPDDERVVEQAALPGNVKYAVKSWSDGAAAPP